MRKPQEVYDDWLGRRKGIIRALTTDSEEFYKQCDPQKDNMTLFAFPDGTWHATLPSEEVPPEVPEPALGINFARDGMSKKDWLGLVAVHSDSWLLALAFYKAARFDAGQRQELFDMINKWPTCYEVVTGRAAKNAPLTGAKRPAPGAAGGRKGGRGGGDDDDEEVGVRPHSSRWTDGDGDPCPGCGRKYNVSEFWIACDECDTWYCGRCSKMNMAKAEKMKKWRCENCNPPA
uniref:Zinc finger PHD-type domain-containing protein n=1 Tax=Chlamydomonas leiostraca TaxID=1034604 RepID=A0A7S0S218_9CHLO|mmetsp:Transcript_518/g.1384  ORF Transcript_518/g.1384 Transcript_518/m.1384 type:complete len:233 (+) Transcript_518:66-764(+)